MAHQKLWTKEIERRIKANPLYSHDGEGERAPVAVKFFNPYGLGTWLITEGEYNADEDDWTLYGYCHLYEWEWGYVSLRELERIRVNVFGCKLPLERDISVTGKTTVADELKYLRG